jgi:hypothetical protein
MARAKRGANLDEKKARIEAGFCSSQLMTKEFAPILEVHVQAPTQVSIHANYLCS